MESEKGSFSFGPLFSEPMQVETVRPGGPETWIVGLVGSRSQQFRRVTLGPEELKALRVVEAVRVHAAMLLQAGGRANALRALLKAEIERSPDFVRLVNALSALYPKQSEEKRLLDAMLLAIPR